MERFWISFQLDQPACIELTQTPSSKRNDLDTDVAISIEYCVCAHYEWFLMDLLLSLVVFYCCNGSEYVGEGEKDAHTNTETTVHGLYSIQIVHRKNVNHMLIDCIVWSIFAAVFHVAAWFPWRLRCPRFSTVTNVPGTFNCIRHCGKWIDDK